MKKVRTILLFITLSMFLYACGGGGSDTPSYIPPYQTQLVQEKTLTFNRWNQTEQKSAYGEGYYLVVYLDDRENFNALNGEDIWGTIYDTNLNVISEFPIIQRDGRDITPFVLFDNVSKSFLVIWTAYKGLGGTEILSAFVTTDGKVTLNGVVDVAKGIVEVKGFTKINNGYAILFKDIWLTGGQDIGFKVLKVAVVDSNLMPLSVYTVTDDSHMGMKVDPTGASFDCLGEKCLVAYSMAKELLRDNSLHIYGRLLSTIDGTLNPEIRLSDEEKGKAASKTTPIVSAGKDSFLVAWFDFDSEQGSVSVDLAGKYVSLAGNVGERILISDFRWDKTAPVKTGLNGSVFYATITYRHSEGVHYALWSDTRSGTPLDTGLFIRRIGKDKDCILINNMPQDQKTPDLILGKDNKLFATWTQSGVRKEHGHFSADIFGIILPF